MTKGIVVCFLVLLILGPFSTGPILAQSSSEKQSLKKWDPGYFKRFRYNKAGQATTGDAEVRAREGSSREEQYKGPVNPRKPGGAQHTDEQD